jgi:hypothetical protein
MGERARARTASRSWDDVAADLEALYRGVSARKDHPATAAPVFADLRVRTGPALGAADVVMPLGLIAAQSLLFSAR